MPRKYLGSNTSARSRLLELDGKQIRNFVRLIIVGDLHGDYASLCSVLNIADPAKDGILFLGDYADRGESGVEVIEAVDNLLKSHPQNVFALEGNHEAYTESGHPTFGPWTLGKEVNRKIGNWQGYFEKKLKPFIGSLYLAAIVPGETLFVHGGISSRIADLNDLRYPTEDVEKEVIWSDPMEENRKDVDSFGRPKFGPDITENVCRKLGVKRIVRSHEPSRVEEAGGPCYSHRGRMITTSTTTSYLDPITHEPYKPFILSISPDDFSLKCDRILPDGSSKKIEIVSCGP